MSAYYENCTIFLILNNDKIKNNSEGSYFCEIYGKRTVCVVVIICGSDGLKIQNMYGCEYTYLIIVYMGLFCLISNCTGQDLHIYKYNYIQFLERLHFPV